MVYGQVIWLRSHAAAAAKISSFSSPLARSALSQCRSTFTGAREECRAMIDFLEPQAFVVEGRQETRQLSEITFATFPGVACPDN